MNFDFDQEPGKKIHRSFVEGETKPLVSIITPYYKAKKYFTQTYNCIINQTFTWFEWIIVNDGTDDEVPFLDSLAEKDARIKVFYQENAGPGVARNNAISKAQADIIVTLDADDLYHPTYVETLYWGLMKNPDCGWCYSRTVGFFGHTYLWNERFDSERLKTFNYLDYAAAFRKELLIQCGGYDVSEKYCYEDWLMWLRLCSMHAKPLKVGFYGFWYRRLDDGNLARVDNDNALQQKAKHLIELEGFKVKGSIVGKEYPLETEEPIYDLTNNEIWKHGQSLHQSDNPKLLMIIPWMEMGGADIFNLQLLEGLNNRGYDVSVATTVSADNSWRQRFEKLTDEVYDLTSFLDSRYYYEFIRYLIDTRGIDTIMVSNSYLGYYMLPMIREDYPHMAVIDYVHMVEAYWKNGGHARTSSIFQADIDLTYTCNEVAREAMIQSFGVKKNEIQTLYIGTDTKHFNPDVLRDYSIKEKHSIPDNKKIVLFPCRLHPQKRPFLMLEIARRLREVYADFVILIVGDGEQRELLINASLDISDYLVFAGEQKHMAPYYKESDLTLICSIKEGVSLTSYESLAVGTPVVSADVGGQKELIDESVGVLIPMEQDEADDFDARSFPESEVKAYVSTVYDLLSNQTLREEMAANAVKRIRDGFSVELMVEKFVNDLELIKKNKNTSVVDKSVNGSDMPANKQLLDNYQMALNTMNLERKVNVLWKENLWLSIENQVMQSSPIKYYIKRKNLLPFKIMRKLYYSLRKIWIHRIKYTKIGRVINWLKNERK